MHQQNHLCSKIKLILSINGHKQLFIIIINSHRWQKCKTENFWGDGSYLLQKYRIYSSKKLLPVVDFGRSWITVLLAKLCCRHGRHHKFKTVYAYFLCLPSLSFPFPTLSPHPSLHSLPLPSHTRWMGPNPTHPSPPFPSPPSFLSPGVPLPKPARGSGGALAPQWGLGQSPSLQTIWCISWPKGAALVATVFLHFIRINVIFCDFEAEAALNLACHNARKCTDLLTSS